MQVEHKNINLIFSANIRIALYFIAVFCLCEIGFLLPAYQNKFHDVWLVTGFIFAILLSMKGKKKLLFLALGLVACIITDFANGINIWSGAEYNLAVGSTVFLLTVIISRYYKGKIVLTRLKDFLLIVLFPSFFIPFICFFLEKSIFRFDSLFLLQTEALNSILSHVIGFLIFTPFLIFRQEIYLQYFKFYKKTEIPIAILLFSILTAITFYSVNGTTPIFFYELFFIFFIVILITYRYGIKGTSLALLAIVLAAIIALNLLNPGHVVFDELYSEKMASYKLFFVTASVVILSFAIVFKQNKISEFELQNSNSLLNATLESTEDGILTVDLYGMIVTYNKKFLELWNIPLYLAETKNDSKLINFILKQVKEPDEFISLVSYLYSHPSKESLDFIEFIDERVYERYSKPQKIEDKIIGRVWSFRDITEQRKAEAELVRARDAYLKVLDDAPALIWRADSNAKCDWFNKAWLEFTGRPIELELGDGWAQGVHPDDLNRCFDYYMEHFSKKLPFTMEYRLRRADNRYRWIIDIGKPNYNHETEFLGYIGYCFDITERKEAESKIIQSEKLTSEIIANVPEIIVLHINGIVQFINKTGEDALGFSSQEVIGKDLKLFFEPSQYAIVTEKMNKRVIGEKVEDYEIEIYTKQRVKKNVIIRAVTIDYHGRNAVLAILVDITEIKAYETKLEELNATKNKLLSIISHDLKGPFQGFLGVSDLLANQIDTLSADETKSMALELNTSLQKQYHLLVEILNWTKMQNNGIIFEPVELNLYKEIQNTIRSLETNASRKNITFRVEVDLSQFIYADPNMFQVVMRNLLSNAIKFSFRKGFVKISAENKNNSTDICVIDNGVGIDPDDLERLFLINKRFSTEGTENEQGTGLGLIFCKEIMEKHNGIIKCESKKGNGSRFCLSFPKRVAVIYND